MDRLVNFVIETLDDVEIHGAELSIVRVACEAAIKQLSTVEKTEITIGDRTITITRPEYELLIKPYVETTIKCISNALYDAEIDKDEIDKIVLVGGCSHTPLIQMRLEDFFGKAVFTGINPMEAVAHGACLYGAVLKKITGAPNMYVRNATPLSLGMVTTQNRCVPFIPRNTPYPVERRFAGCTVKDKQTKARFIIFEGEQTYQKDNKKLGSMLMEGINPAPKGEEKFHIWLKINEKGVISARAENLRSNNQKELVIQKPKKFTSEQLAQMSQMVAELQKGVEPPSPPLTFKLQLKEKLEGKRPKIDKEKKEEELRCPIYGGFGLMNYESTIIEVED